MNNLIKFLKTYQPDIILAIAVVLISITSFNLGKISAGQEKMTPITITNPETDKESGTTTNDNSNSQLRTINYGLQTSSVVASKNSTGKLYHFPWCSSASKIAEKNKITFATEAAAIAAGYTLAGNCTR